MFSSLPQNPFTRPAFWGRQYEITSIYKRLLSTPPQCCALIGENSFGKTSLLRALPGAHTFPFMRGITTEDNFAFIYLDCISYVESSKLEDQASARFWWNLYNAAWTKLQRAAQPPLSLAGGDGDSSPLDRAFELKSLLEDAIRQQTRPVIFLFDNFEGIAHLPLRDSMWLRSLVQYSCAYVVTSRYLLYLLYQYHEESWASPSPLWNLFTEPIYLGLIDEDEVNNFLRQAGELARLSGSLWEAEDIRFIRQIAGRHPELIRIACARLFEQRLKTNLSLRMNEEDFRKVLDAHMMPVCRLLWQGLENPELWDLPGLITREKKEGGEESSFSPYQKALLDLAHGREVADQKLLYVLEQRGLLDYTDNNWRIFAEAMRRYVLEQETKQSLAERQRLPETASPRPPLLTAASTQQSQIQPFTYLEEKVYSYLKSHVGKVCDREEIKQAVWEPGGELPGNSALQKIIERIRRKIEFEPDNPHYLISIRGQGYMLREDPSKSGPV